MSLKKSSKNIGSKKERFELLLEDIQSEVHVISEQSVAHTEQLEAIGGRLDKMETLLEKQDLRLSKLEMILEKQTENEERFEAFERRLARIESHQ